MNTIAKSVIVCAGSVVMALAPAFANADRVYYLVGLRHMYLVGADKDSYANDRMQIEQNYADRINGDQEVFEQHVGVGKDAGRESEMLNADLDAAAEDRDEALSNIYTNADSLQEQHPELKLQEDGPYLLMGVDEHWEAETLAFDDYVLFAPWIGYLLQDGIYFGGWEYEKTYTKPQLVASYSAWRHDTVEGSRPYVGLNATSGSTVIFAPSKFRAKLRAKSTIVATSDYGLNGRQAINRSTKFKKVDLLALKPSMDKAIAGTVDTKNRIDGVTGTENDKTKTKANRKDQTKPNSTLKAHKAAPKGGANKDVASGGSKKSTIPDGRKADSGNGDTDSSTKKKH